MTTVLTTIYHTNRYSNNDNNGFRKTYAGRPMHAHETLRIPGRSPVGMVYTCPR